MPLNILERKHKPPLAMLLALRRQDFFPATAFCVPEIGKLLHFWLL